MPKRFGRWSNCWNTEKAHERRLTFLPLLFLAVHVPSSSDPVNPNPIEHG